MTTVRQWLGRLSFSFLIIAMVCGWEAYQAAAGNRPAAPAWRAPVLSVSAAVAFVFFLAGTRARHARRDDYRPDEDEAA